MGASVPETGSHPTGQAELHRLDASRFDPARKFTRGPWMVMPEEAEKLYIRVRGTRLGERFKIANAPFPIADESEKQEALANARLIAAAPDLFEAVRLFVEEYDAADQDEGVAMMLAYNAALEAAKAALAKARGEA
jgi:hypothetical protein